MKTASFLSLIMMLTCCCAAVSGCNGKSEEGTALFTFFTYSGNDARFDKELDWDSEYLNPVLSGFYPDPSICRRGEDYFLVNSTFAYFPGVPIFHSRDLVNWRQIGHVLDRPSQLNLDGLHIACGVYAPAISYNPHNETFYMINTIVAGIGNFYVKTKDPFKGEWSDPILLPSLQGIDPSFLFDDDGKAYIVGNGDCPGEPQWEGHTAIWLYDFDWENDCVVGERKLLVDGGVDKSTQPIWIEGPHLYHAYDKYWLMCAEGGTETGHSEVMFVSDSPYGPFKPLKNNPILTQRDLPEERPEKVTSTGHADIIQTADGSWWAVFLGCRPYEGDLYNTGRETFLLPVEWTAEGPVILAKGEAVPTVVSKAGLGSGGGLESGCAGADCCAGGACESGCAGADGCGGGADGCGGGGAGWDLLTGNFTWSDDFSSPQMGMQWIQLRTPRDTWWNCGGGLRIKAVGRSINDSGCNPAFMAVRQQHTCFTAETELRFSPEGDALAGLAYFQNERNNYVLGKMIVDGVPSVVLWRSDKEQGRRMIDSAPLKKKHWNADLGLRIEVEGNVCRFSYSTNGLHWIGLGGDQDARILSTRYDGGFTGAVIGCYATSVGR